MGMTETKIIDDLEDVDQKLNAIGLDIKLFQEVANHYALTVLDMDDTHPSWARAITPMGEAHHALKQNAREYGWVGNETKGFSLAVNETHKLAINIAKGCENTGNPKLNPMTAPKGVFTLQAVNQNQLTLDLGDNPKIEPLRTDGMLTYYLLLRYQSGKVQSELSLPALLNDEKRIHKWHERILFPTISLDTEPESSKRDDSIIVDVPVRRKGQK